MKHLIIIKSVYFIQKDYLCSVEEVWGSRAEYKDQLDAIIACMRNDEDQNGQ